MRSLTILAFGIFVCAGCQGGPQLDDGGHPIDSAINPALDGAMAGGGRDLAMQAMTPLCSSAPATADLAKQQSRQCSIGTGAPFLLREAPYPKMIIEINATTGTTLRMAAIDHLKAVIADVCGKSGGVTVVTGDMNIPAPGHPITLAEVQAMEDAHRTTFASGDTAVFYYLVVSDPSTEDTAQFKILGYAHRAFSMVVFQGTVDSVSGGIGQPSHDIVEETVVAHEFGHVLGLVNLGTPMVANHEDPNHLAHDVNDKCLMYYANNSSAGLANLIGGGTVADFDAPCRADLMAVRNSH